MGIVKISDGMHDNLRVAGSALNRSINAQAEHWLLLGMLAELHPDLTHSQICQMLVKAELSGDASTRSLSQWIDRPPPVARGGLKLRQ